MAQTYFYARLGCTPQQRAKLVERADIVKVDGTGNPAMPTPNPTLGAIETAKLECVAAGTAAANGDREKIAIWDQKCETLYDLLRLLAQHVDEIADGNKLTIESLGFVADKEKEAHGTPATNTIKQGKSAAPQFSVKLDLQRPLLKGIQYDVRGMEHDSALPFDPDTANWSANLSLQGQPSSKLLLSGLTRKKEYVFQVRGSDRGKKGFWSQPFFHVAI